MVAFTKLSHNDRLKLRKLLNSDLSRLALSTVLLLLPCLAPPGRAICFEHWEP